MFIWDWLAQEVVELPGPPPRDAGQMADALLASMAGPAQQAEEAAPEAAQAIQRPMDLFKSIFEASDSSDSSEEDEPEPAPAPAPAMAAVMKGPQPAPRPQAVQASAAAAPLAEPSSFWREATSLLQPGNSGSAMGPQQENGPAEASAKPVHVFQSRQQRQAQAAAAQLQALDPSLPRMTGLPQPSGAVSGDTPAVAGLEGAPGNGLGGPRGPGSVSEGDSDSSDGESEGGDEGIRAQAAVGRESRQAGRVGKRKGKHKGKSSKKSKQKEGKHKAKRKHKRGK